MTKQKKVKNWFSLYTVIWWYDKGHFYLHPILSRKLQLSAYSSVESYNFLLFMLWKVSVVSFCRRVYLCRKLRLSEQIIPYIRVDVVDLCDSLGLLKLIVNKTKLIKVIKKTNFQLSLVCSRGQGQCPPLRRKIVQMGRKKGEMQTISLGNVNMCKHRGRQYVPT